ncbi:MAG: chloride channel protein [Eggerthellaceae bacterium]|nr:chloride channel protein [Eggerthellaceae bacterium]
MNHQGKTDEPRQKRPDIRSAASNPHALDTPAVRFGMVALALAVGFVVGLVVFLLLNASGWLTSLVWDGLGGTLGVPWFPLATCTIGGLIIGVWTLATNDRVYPLEHVLGTFKRTGSYRTNGSVKPVVSFLLPLVFGGSVGFEAGLTGIITSCCCWIRDKLKAAGLRAAAVADVTIAASMSAIFGTPFAGIVAGAESAPGTGLSDTDAYDMRRNVKLVLYTAAAVGAFGGISLLSELFGTTGGLPRFEAIQASYAELLWALPCIVAAYVLTLVFHGSSTLFGRLKTRFDGIPLATVICPIIAGIIMGSVAMAFPYVLFPGETQSEELMGMWMTWSAGALLATGVLKAAITPMCLNMGWMGGSFFPSIFAGVACGYGLAAFTGADPMLMVTVTTAAHLAGVTRKPLLSLAILVLCFPLSGIIWSGLAAVVGGSLPIPHALLGEQEQAVTDSKRR